MKLLIQAIDPQLLAPHLLQYVANKIGKDKKIVKAGLTKLNKYLKAIYPKLTILANRIDKYTSSQESTSNKNELITDPIGACYIKTLCKT